MTLPPDILNRWCAGQLLAFSGLDGRTDYTHGLTARALADGAGLEVVWPGKGRVAIPGPPGAGCRLGGDFFEIDSAEGPVRGAFLDAYHLLIEGPCAVGPCDDALVVFRAPPRTLIAARATGKAEKLGADLDHALAHRRRWLECRRVPPGVGDAARQTMYRALSIMKTQVYTPEGLIGHRWTTPDRWPHRKMWLWDSAFHAAGWRHVDPALARDMLSAVLDAQAADGFVPHAAGPAERSEITQPPLLGLGVELVQSLDPQPDWIEEVYPKLALSMRWILANRDRDGDGLLEWRIEGDPRCRCGESGMDNSPRFDAAPALAAVDFNAYAALECELLARFARQLGRYVESREWRLHAERLRGLLNERLWDEAAGIYCDADPRTGLRSPVRSSAGFLPLVCGAASPRQAERLAEHLRNPDTFGTAMPVPSIAAGDRERYAPDMWRGPVWVNVNWLIAAGFDRGGLPEAAAWLRERTAAEIERQVERHNTLFEFYDPFCRIDPPQLQRKGRCAPEASPYHQVFHDYGWTATLYVDMILGKDEAGQVLRQPPSSRSYSWRER